MLVDKFKEKLLQMKPSDIVMAMVDGLKDPCTVVDMTTFGNNIGDICYGCAATNTICRITDHKFTLEEIALPSARAIAIGSNYYTITRFENAIDMLRRANRYAYNAIIGDISITLQIPGKYIMTTTLRALTTDNYIDNLLLYENLANALKADGY